MSEVTQKRRFISLRYKVLMWLLLAAMVPLSIVSVMLYSETVDILIQNQSTMGLSSLTSVATNITTIMDNVREISLQLIQDENLSSVLRKRSTAEAQGSGAYLSALRSTAFYIGEKGWLNSIRVGNDNVEVVSSARRKVVQTPVLAEILERVELEKGGQVWFGDYSSFMYSLGGQFTISMIRNVNSILNPAEKLGMMRIDINESSIAALFGGEERSGHVYLIEADGAILSSSDREIVGRNIERIVPLEEIVDGQLSQVGRGAAEQLVCAVPVNGSDWRLVNVLPMSYILDATSGVRSIMAACVLISIALCVLISIYGSRSLLSPLMNLSHHMKNLKENNYKVSLKLDSNDEIGQLFESFNDMSSKLDELINEVYERKIHQEESELKALQAQINPHFLYNNLDTAYWMSRIENAENTGKIVLALSNLFKLNIRTAEQVIPVGTEVEHIMNYIIIQRIRFEDSVRFDIQVEEDVEKLGTSRFVLQPLIENALYHGILPKGSGCVRIRIFRERDELLFSVEDDGEGGDADEINTLLLGESEDGTRGFAIRNVHKRITLRFGEGYGLSFADSVLGGMRVMVRQPALAYGEQP